MPPTPPTASTSRKKTGRKAYNPVRSLFFTYNADLDESTCILGGCKSTKVAGNHAGNLEKHIQRNHKDKLNLLLSEKKKHIGRVGKDKQLSLQVKISVRKLKLACVRLVAVHGRPFELMNDEAFQDIVSPILNALPARQRFAINDDTVRQMVSEEAVRLRQFLKDEVKGRLLSLKVDSTTKGGSPYFGVNIQFSRDGEIQLRTLAVRRLFTRQTAENLKREILEILENFEIDVRQIITFTCDNGMNMLRAADLLREKQREKDYEDLELDVDDVQDDIDIDLGVQGVDGEGLTSVKCAAHTLQLAVWDDSLKKSPGKRCS